VYHSRTAGNEVILPPSSKMALSTFPGSVRLWCPLILAIAANFVSCGGGSSGGGQSSSPPVTPDFALSVSPTTLSIQDGQSGTASLSATGSNGFSSAVTVQVSGLPTGVTISPSSISLTPGTPLQITISAAASAPTTTASITFTGTSGTLTHTAQLAMTNSITVTSNTPPFRMRYTRTDAVIEYSMWLNAHWIIYNPPTNRFFVTDPFSNRVFVLDAATESMIGTIIVPGAFNVDDTQDHTSLYVGTKIGDIYVIDPVGMVVTKRYVASEIGPSGFPAYSVLVMGNGTLALLGEPATLPRTDGYQEFAFWNPSTNSITVTNLLSSGICGPPMVDIGWFSRTPDRSKLVFASIASDGTLCEIDPSTGTALHAQPGTYVEGMALTPDSKWLITFGYNGSGTGQAHVLDVGTLAQVAQFPINASWISNTYFFVGPDSKTLYVTCDTAAYAYDLSSGNELGWLPDFFLMFTSSGEGAFGPVYGPQFGAMDGTGLIAGPMEEGVAFLDTTTLRTGAVGSQFTNGYLNPATGPTAGGTQTTWVADGVVGAGITPPTGTISDVYFGSLTASSPSLSSGTITATTPPGAPGPVDVYVLTTDGGVQYVPEGFSYGPSVLEVTPNATAAGGGPGMIFGYGFGATSSNEVPSSLQVKVGGASATITAFYPYGYGILYPPFPLEAFSYTIPPGTAGSSADVTVTSSSGSTSVHNAMTYLPALQQYPLTSASLAQGIYDPHRDVYYFTDATKIQVFSRTQGAWLAPITIPAPYTPKRLWGVALSPNGDNLAVSDATGGAIYVLNPDAPSTVRGFSIPQYQGYVQSPLGIAISDAGIAYYWTIPVGAVSMHFNKLDTSSGTVTAYDNCLNSATEPLCVLLPNPTSSNYLRTAISGDNSKVFGNGGGTVFVLDTATDTASYATLPSFFTDTPLDFDLSLSADQTRLAATGYSYDSNLNAESCLELNMRESKNLSYLYGEKLSPNGALLFQPTTVGIDVLDGRLYVLLDRIALPITPSSQYDALVSDGTDNILVAITGTNSDGVAVIDLRSIPTPAPLPYETDVVATRNSVSTGPASRVRRGNTTGQPSTGLPSRPVHLVIPHVTKPISPR